MSFDLGATGLLKSTDSEAHGKSCQNAGTRDACETSSSVHSKLCPLGHQQCQARIRLSLIAPMLAFLDQ